ncbi:MAG: hypothetical protein DRJ60_00270 [Thermoprotei archaeon]|nr:MAG: hypothetical protein DRJ60_00270 [Thermoprotei archaeon]
MSKNMVKNKKNRGPIVDGFYKYREELIAAVEYLMKYRGITRNSEIARRLNVSPFTVRNIKQILKRRKARKEREKAEPKKPKDIIEEILGGEQ